MLAAGVTAMIAGTGAAARRSRVARFDAVGPLTSAEMAAMNGVGPRECTATVMLHEIEAATGERAGGRSTKRFERQNVNGDGAAARAGLDPMAEERFGRSNAAGCGTVTREELQGTLRRGG